MRYPLPVGRCWVCWWFVIALLTKINLRLFYQLDFVTPGIFPSSAISLNIFLDKPKCLMNPLGLPVNWQRFLSLTGDAFFGNWSKDL